MFSTEHISGRSGSCLPTHLIGNETGSQLLFTQGSTHLLKTLAARKMLRSTGVSSKCHTFWTQKSEKKKKSKLEAKSLRSSSSFSSSLVWRPWLAGIFAWAWMRLCNQYLCWLLLWFLLVFAHIYIYIYMCYNVGTLQRYSTCMRKTEASIPTTVMLVPEKTRATALASRHSWESGKPCGGWRWLMEDVRKNAYIQYYTCKYVRANTYVNMYIVPKIMHN